MRQKARSTERGDDPSSPDIHWGGLGSIAGFHLRLSQAVIHRDFSARIRPLGLSQTQYAVLVLVEANPGISQIAIAKALSSDRATMMALVNRLELRGLIERGPSATDRRKQELRITQEGRLILTKAARIIKRHERAAFAALSAEEIDHLVSLLKRIHAS